MFQKKINELFSSMSSVFGIADDILIAGFDEWSKDCEETLEKVPQVCREANLKLSKDRSLSRCTSVSFLDEIIHKI